MFFSLLNSAYELKAHDEIDGQIVNILKEKTKVDPGYVFATLIAARTIVSRDLIRLEVTSLIAQNE